MAYWRSHFVTDFHDIPPAYLYLVSLFEGIFEELSLNYCNEYKSSMIGRYIHDKANDKRYGLIKKFNLC